MSRTSIDRINAEDRCVWHGKHPSSADIAPHLLCLASLLAIGIAIDPFPIAQQPIFLNKIASAVNAESPPLTNGKVAFEIGPDTNLENKANHYGIQEAAPLYSRR